ncbi:hypothetical protein COP2_035615 [Malus domestica]
MISIHYHSIFNLCTFHSEGYAPVAILCQVLFFTRHCFVRPAGLERIWSAMNAFKDNGVIVLLASEADVDAADKEKRERYLNSKEKKAPQS